MKTSNKIILAIFVSLFCFLFACAVRISAYTITYTPTTYITSESSSYTHEFTDADTITLPESSAPAGYSFGGWRVSAQEGNWVNGTVYEDSTIAAGKEGNVTLQAVFNANQYVITFNYNGATAGNSKVSINATFNSTIEGLPEPVKNGFTFRGWYTTEIYNSVPNPSDKVSEGDIYNKVADNMVLHAYWQLNDFDVNHLSSVVKTYDGNVSYLVVNPDHDAASQGSYSYTWSRRSSQASDEYHTVTKCTTNQCAVKEVIDSGLYSVRIIFTVPGFGSVEKTVGEAEVYINEKSVTISGFVGVDRIADGSAIGTVRGGTISGIIAGDDCSFTLNKSEYTLDSNQPGSYTIIPEVSLTGTQKYNYRIDPGSVSSVVINIRQRNIQSGSKIVKLISDTEGFRAGSDVMVSDETNNMSKYQLDTSLYGSKLVIQKGYKIEVKDNNEIVTFSNDITVNLSLDKRLLQSGEMHLLHIKANGAVEEIQAFQKKEGAISFKVRELGTFVVLTPAKSYRGVYITIGIIAFVFVAAAITIYIIRLQKLKTIKAPKKAEKQDKMDSVHKKYLEEKKLKKEKVSKEKPFKKKKKDAKE